MEARPTRFPGWLSEAAGCLSAGDRRCGRSRPSSDRNQTRAIADLVREAKRVSSEWVKEAQGVQKFSWQEGYGAFSVSKSAVPSVRKYIQEQEKHHRRRTFQEEYLEFLEKNGVEYDERYLW
jgi:hypothetical protein